MRGGPGCAGSPHSGTSGDGRGEDVDDKIFDMFVESCLEQLSGIESAVLDLEKAAPHEARDKALAVFRAAHTIKGDAGAMGAAPLAELCHAVESVLSQVREGSRSVDVALCGELLRAFDLMRSLVRRVHEVLDGAPDVAAQAAEEVARLTALAACRCVAAQSLPSPAAEAAVAAVAASEPALATPPGGSGPSRGRRGPSAPSFLVVWDDAGR